MPTQPMTAGRALPSTQSIMALVRQFLSLARFLSPRQVLYDYEGRKSALAKTWRLTNV